MQGINLAKKEFKFLFQPVIVSADCANSKNCKAKLSKKSRKSFDSLHHKSAAVLMLNKIVKKATFNIKFL